MDMGELGGKLRCHVTPLYAACIHQAGGVPVMLPLLPELCEDLLARVQGVVFTGGDDPYTECFGEPTHPQATPVHTQRQDFELAMLNKLAERDPDKPVLGICLGMQMMALHAGGKLDQHMPETTASAADHFKRDHALVPAPVDPKDLSLPAGVVHSCHRQAVVGAGAMQVIGRAHDGVIEAVAQTDRAFYMGVQWHPERTTDHGLGQGLFDRLIQACNTSA